MGKDVVKNEGRAALITGWLPTFQGYFVQGWFKFGGVEICKTKFAQAMGSERSAYANRNAITLGASAVAEFVADVFLCPYEAVRIRGVSDPGYASGGMLATGKKIYQGLGSSPDKMSKTGVITVSLGSGVIAGVAAATISQPADGLLSKVNKKGAGGEGSMMVRLGRIAAETGFVKLCTQGLFARWIHVGLITAGQFAVVDACMMAVGASRFHFHDPDKH